MRQTTGTRKSSGEKIVKDIKQTGPSPRLHDLSTREFTHRGTNLPFAAGANLQM